MKKININNFKYTCSNNNNLYIFEVRGNVYLFKKINLGSDKKDYIRIFNDTIYIERYDKTGIVFLSNLEKDSIVNDIFNILNSTMVNDCIDLDFIKKKIKNSYIRYLVTDGNIGLSSLTINDNTLDVILIENKDIIGEIKIEKDIKVNVIDNYLKRTLNLLNRYINLFINNENKDKYIKVLK